MKQRVARIGAAQFIAGLQNKLNNTWRSLRSAISLALLCLYSLMPVTAHAQNTVYFSTSDVGVTKSITDWGVDMTWASSDNMRQSLVHMGGATQIDMVRLNFYKDEALQSDGTLGTNSKARIDYAISMAAQAGNKPLALSPDSGDATAPWYLNGSSLRTDRWVQVIQATQQYIAQKYGKTIAAVEPFNEPDYWPGEGTAQNLNDIMVSLHNIPAFQNAAMVGASTLNSNVAQSWYDQIAGPATHGSTHQLAGSTNSYVNFIQHVQASGDIPYNPELHSMVEAIYGAEYGLEGGIWWGSVLRTRGLFVQSCQGKRLGYAENRDRQTAAAVYRAPNGQIRAFAGGFERDGSSTAYRFVSTDRDVYFNGVGPIREYMVQVGQGEDAYADIQYGANIMPALDGNRWKILNRQTGQVMEVANGSTGDGALIRSAADTGALNQRWNIVRDKDGYYALFNANSGRTAEVADGSLADGASVRQWGMADNLPQHWFIEDASNGYYFLRNGNSNKYLTSSTNNSIQFDNTGSYLQQWQFVLSNPAPTGTLKAQYNFQGNANDGTGVNHGVANGNPTYGNGPTGQGLAINLDGVNDYVTLPSGVASSSDITVSALVKWNGGSAWQRIFDFGNNTTSYMFLTPLSGYNTMRFAIATAGTGSEQILDTDPLPTGQWVHLAVTLSGNTGVLYVNGKPRVAGQILLNPSDINPTLNFIGKSQWPDPLFSGMIDDFRIYGYALDQSQMANLVPRRWTGALSSSWTTATLSNPKNWQVVSTAADYVGGDVVLLDDNAVNFTVNVTDTTVSPSSILFDNSTHNYILNGPGAIAGSGALTKNGSGALTINNRNTYSGGTVLNAGTLNINNASAIGAGSLTIAAGATIDNTSGSTVNLSTNNPQTWNGDFTFGGSNALNMGTGVVTMTGNRTVTVNDAGALTVGPIGQSGGSWQLTKTGSGTLVLGGNIAYSGDTVVLGGTLEIAGDITANGTSFIDVQSGKTVLKTASIYVTNLNINTADTASFEVASGAYLVGSITGSGATQIDPDASLTADSIVQNTLTIGNGARVTILPLPGGPLSETIAAVPEPSSISLLVFGVLSLLAYAWWK
jgi:autotransporter-associated beta strand protein